MGWFDEQISKRVLSDQETMEDSLLHIASAVLGTYQTGTHSGNRAGTADAINDILMYYKLKPCTIPENVQDLEERLELCIRPHGLMWRTVRLEEGWYKNAMGPMLAFRKEDGAAVSLLPQSFYGYRCRCGNGEPCKVDETLSKGLSEEAICFYYPLPLKKLGVIDLLTYLKNCLSLSDCAAFCLLSLAVTLIGMLLAAIVRILTGFVLESGSISLLAGTAVFMISALLSSQLISTAKQLTMSRIVLKASVSMEAALMMRIMSLPAGFFRQHSSGELSSRYNAVNRLCSLLLENVFSTGIGALLSLLYIGLLFHYAPALGGPAILIILTGMILSMISGLMQMQISRRIMESSSLEQGLSFALISGVQKIRLAGAEKRAFAKWGHAYANTAALSYNPPMFLRINKAVSMAVSLAGTILLYFLAVKSAVTPSGFLAFNTAYGAVTAAFAALSSAALSVAGIRPMLKMAEPILEAVPEASEDRAMVTRLSGNIELPNVCFRYSKNSPFVINKMDLRIHAGEYIGIVGTTGCGKSTLVRLLLGFETPEIGAVYYDGKDLGGLDLHSLRRRIGTVTQDGRLFQGDIFHNISISAPGMSLEDAWAAAELAGIAEDIREMPMGMNTQISEGQGGISGGQKQRLMIARALAPKPNILIFDEATSALDNRTQQQISEAIDGLNCTRIVIAHRLSTIRNCSRILVLDQGRIIEEGSYEELLQKDGLFAELIARQRLDT